MSIDWGQVAKAYYDELPHPNGHGLKIKEFATAVKLATMIKFGGHAEPHEAAMFWQEFAPGGVPLMSPQDFEHALEKVAPLSYVFHGRPPSLKEVAELAGKASHEVRRYFADLPSKTHPEISAGDFVKAYQAARPWARQHLEREPVATEAAYLHHSGESPAVYYQRISRNNTQQQDGLSATQRGVGGDSRLQTAGRQAPDQRDQRG